MDDFGVEDYNLLSYILKYTPSEIVLVGGIANIMAYFFSKVDKSMRFMLEFLISTILGFLLFIIFEIFIVINKRAVYLRKELMSISD